MEGNSTVFEISALTCHANGPLRASFDILFFHFNFISVRAVFDSFGPNRCVKAGSWLRTFTTFKVSGVKDLSGRVLLRSMLS